MEKLFRDYLEFLDAIILFRTVRDMDSPCSPGPPPELWLDMRLDDLATTTDYDDETRRWLILASKMAELIDDRKQWLLDDIENDLKEAVRDMPLAA